MFHVLHHLTKWLNGGETAVMWKIAVPTNIGVVRGTVSVATIVVVSAGVDT